VDLTEGTSLTPLLSTNRMPFSNKMVLPHLALQLLMKNKTSLTMTTSCILAPRGVKDPKIHCDYGKKLVLVTNTEPHKSSSPIPISPICVECSFRLPFSRRFLKESFEHVFVSYIYLFFI